MPLDLVTARPGSDLVKIEAINHFRGTVEWSHRIVRLHDTRLVNGGGRQQLRYLRSIVGAVQLQLLFRTVTELLDGRNLGYHELLLLTPSSSSS